MYRLLAGGGCRKVLAEAETDEEAGPPVFVRLYVAAAHACLGNVSQSKEAFQQVEDLEWPPDDGGSPEDPGITQNRAGCVYNAVVTYLQIDRPTKRCEPESSTPESSTPESSTPESSTPESSTPESS